MSKRKTTTIGQISFDELYAMMQAGEDDQEGNLVNAIPDVSPVDDWASMLDFDESDADINVVSELSEPESEVEYILEPEPEVEDILNIVKRTGIPKVYSPATEPMLPTDVMERTKANITALLELEKLRAADAYADAAQQDILAAYTGWDGIDVSKNKDVVKELKLYFSEEEITELGALPRQPYAESELVRDIIKSVLKTISFKSGNILVHGTGNGNVTRYLPKKMLKDSRLTFDATNEVSADITSFLFPKNEVFQPHQVVRESFYDLAIAFASAHPEGNGVVVGKRGEIELPNYACSIVRSLSAVRNGGFLLLMIESSVVDSMMLSHSPFSLSTAPLNFVGGLRMSADAFNSEKSYDILVFNKTEKKLADDRGLLERVYISGSYVSASSYFVCNPEYVIGTLDVDNYTSVVVNDISPAEQFAKVGTAIKSWGCNGLYREIEVDEETEGSESLPAYPSVKNYSMVVIGGEVYQRIDSRMVKQKYTGRALERVKGMISLRNQVRKVIDIQVAECEDEELVVEQKRLNALYDAFVKAFGHLSTSTNLRLFREDAEVTLLTALEYTDEEDVIHKADIFTKRTIKMRTSITSCDTPQEAYTVCLDHKGVADVSYMAALCKKTEDEIIGEIGGTLIFRDPSAGAFDEQWVAADEYLSGNVVDKLERAKEAAEDSDEFEPNIKALEAVQPAIIPAHDIQASIGSLFIDKNFISQFIFEVIGGGTIGGSPDSFSFSKTSKGAVRLRARCYIPPTHANFFDLYGTRDYGAIWIIERLVNKMPIVAMKDEINPSTGNVVRVKDVDKTLVLNEKAILIENEFKNWLFNDAAREAEVVHEYNRKYNSVVIPKYDGSHLSFPGMTATINLKQHQKNAVYRIIRDNGALIGHVVGAGKTITLLAAGMELKRLGRVSKPVYLVPNNLLAQWGGEMMRLYPTSNILLAEPEDMRKHRRKRFLARLATGDFDAIILGSSSFTQIPAPASVVKDYVHGLYGKIVEKRFSSDERKYANVKFEDMVPQRMRDDMLKTFMSNQTADYTLEELGVDYLFVDEAHEFKNLYSGSARGQIRGIGNSGAAKSSDLFYKIQYLSKLHGGKGGFTFATGTPIVNTIVELYSWQRFYQEDLLIENGILSLDDWLALFANVESVWELPPEGLDEDGQGFRQVNRVASFKNVPELMKMVLQFLDCVTRDEIDMDTPDVFRKTVNCKPTLYQQDYMKELVTRANAIRSKNVNPRIDNMLKVTMDGRKAALDVRIVNSKASDSKTSKVSECAAQVLEYYTKFKSFRGTQVVFSDISTPNQSDFNVYSALKTKLISLGIPEDEIAFAHDFKTDRQRTTMRIKMQTGRLRVLIGSTQTIGQGVNIQNRLTVLHNMDVPWVPKDIDQREGRIVRPGNMNPSVIIVNYVTEGSFDAYMWQTIELKARLISQILRGDFTQRVVEDTDTKVLSYSEIKAIATGDTRFLKRAKLEGEIAKLETLKRNFNSQRGKLKQDVHKNLPKTIESLKKLIPRIEKDIESLEALNGASVFEYKGVSYDLNNPVQRSEAVKALPKSTFGYNPGDTFGTYNGMSVVLASQATWTSVFSTKDLTVVLQGNATHRIDGDTCGSGRMILELCQRVTRCIPSSLEEKMEKLRSNELALVAATDLLNEPFEQEDLLVKLKEEYEEISRSLAA